MTVKQRYQMENLNKRVYLTVQNKKPMFDVADVLLPLLFISPSPAAQGEVPFVLL